MAKSKTGILSVIDLCVGAQSTLRDILEVLQYSPFHICLVTGDNGQLLGTITDGDCRRALLKGATLETRAESIMKKEFVMVESSFSMEHITALMRVNDVEQIPIVDENKRVIDIVTSGSLVRNEETRSTPAFILAGGQGRRLRPLTESIPKPMLPVQGKPMIIGLIERLVSSRITDIFVSTNYLGEIIEESLGSGSQFGCTITYVKETKELGTAGPLKLAEEQITRPILVVNGDLVTNVDFAACLDFHSAHDFDMTIGVSSHSVEIPFGVVSTGDDGLIVAVEEKPLKTFPVNAGLYVVNPELIPHIPSDTHFPMTDLIQKVIEAGYRVGAFPIHERWVDVGLPQQYQDVQKQNDEAEQR